MSFFTAKPSPEAVEGISLQSFMESLAVNLIPKASAEVNQIVGMIFPDTQEAFTIHVRHGVAEIRPSSVKDMDSVNFDIKVTADSRAWKEMLAKIRSPLMTLAGFEYNPGSAIAFGKFLSLFDPAKMKRPYEPVPGS